MIHLTDLNGDTIEVTDLDEVIQVTVEYKDYSHTDEAFSAFDRKQRAYWTDMHAKLIAIKERITAL